MFAPYAAAYCVVATESIGRQVPIAFLERIKDEFMKKCGAKGHAAAGHTLTHEFGYFFCYYLILKICIMFILGA